MRIIAGKYKRTPLLTLDGDLTRPTRDMVKEALFSTIQINEETIVLDLFSGSGAIGLEALSRGAKDVVFNDINKDACRIINTNLSKVKEERIVYNLDYLSCLERVKDYKFSLIYLDPPYAFKEYDKVLKIIDDYDLLAKEGIIIVEVRKDIDLDLNIYSFSQYKNKQYGINKLLYYKR